MSKKIHFTTKEKY